ncbi:hypothetical protein ACHAXS_010760 [Conticribra weissflogii]
MHRLVPKSIQAAHFRASNKARQSRSRRPLRIITQPLSSKQNANGGIFPVHVLGSGSIGILYACALQQSYFEQNSRIFDTFSAANFKPVTLLMRSHHENRLRKHPHLLAPVTILDAPRFGKHASSNRKTLSREFEIPVELIGGLKHDHAPIKSLLLCTKANDAMTALLSVWERLSPSPCVEKDLHQKFSTIIILSNGALAIRDAIYEKFGRSLDESGIDIVLATTTHGAYKVDSDPLEYHSRFRITHAGKGSTYCTNSEFIDSCKLARWDCSILSDLEMFIMLWKKLAVNCVINPLTAIHGVKNGDLLNRQFRHLGSSLEYVMDHILEEVSAVAMIDIESRGHDINAMQSASQHLSVPVLKKFVTNIISKTANNISSMLQDVKSERVTEVRFLNGYVVDFGFNKYSVECPWNQHLCEEVEALQQIHRHSGIRLEALNDNQ